MAETWHGFACDRYDDAGREVFIAHPREPAPGRPWVWRVQFHDHEPQHDVALLEAGFHYVHADLWNLYGGPEAMARMDRVYERMTSTLRLSPRVALVGISRGGLFCYRWAARHPERVACIYGDNPVCDFTSWPGGKGRGPGCAENWERLLEAYGFASEAEALACREQPIDLLRPIAGANIPILHICGDADEVVPYEENGQILRDRYRALGGSIEEIIKPGGKHHPHCLQDPTPIVAFIARHARA